MARKARKARIGSRAPLAIAALLATAAGGRAPAHAQGPWTTTRLSSPPLPAGWDVDDAVLSPNGRVAVYEVWRPSEGPVELRCVSLDGEAGTHSLTAPLSDAFQFGGAVFAPDSRRVAFLAFVPVADGWAAEVWSVEVCRPGAVPVRHAPAGEPVEDPGAGDVRFAAGGQRVLYRSDWTGRTRIYSAPASGGEAIDLGGDEGPETGSFEISPDGQFVLFGRESPAGFADLVRVPAAGPASAATVLVHGEFQGASLPRPVGVPPAGDRIVYLAEDDLPPFGQWQLYSAPFAPPADRQVRLNPTLTLDGTVVLAVLSPDGSRVAYVADQATAGVYELYSVPVAGPATSYVKLSGLMPAGSTGVDWLSDYEPFFLADSSRVVYHADQEQPERYDLHSVPAAGPASAGVRLNANTPEYRYWHASASQDSQLVVFVGAETQVGTTDLHLRRADGTGPELDLYCDGGRPWWGGGGIFASCTLLLDEVPQLYHWRLTGAPGWTRSEVTSLDDDDSGPMRVFGVSRETDGLLFAYDRPVDGSYELYTADRRIHWGGFENGSTTGWSLVVP
jgi:hypothetical protein